MGACSEPRWPNAEEGNVGEGGCGRGAAYQVPPLTGKGSKETHLSSDYPRGARINLHL